MAQFKNYYVGFSTANYEEKGGSFETHNVQTIEDDLLREIYTQFGERVYMVNWGTRIPIMPFELNDTDSELVIKQDIQTVISHDPRVELINLDVLKSDTKNAIVAIAKVNFIEFAVTKDLYIEVNSR